MCFRCLLENVFCLFNFVFLILGICILGLGIGYSAVASSFSGVFDSKYMVGPTVFIVVGCIILVLSFLGCCGAKRDNKCMLKTYMWLLIIILVFEIIVVGLVFGFGKSNSLESITSNMQSKFNTGDQTYFDNLQNKLKCCGVKSSNDYNQKIPDSCYPKNSKTAYNEGCAQALYDYLNTMSNALGAIAIIVAIVLGSGILVSCCLEETKKVRESF